jgi:phosphate:Na+ symporter
MQYISTILAGICFFLYGMRLTKEGLQYTSGDRLRTTLQRSTRSTWRALSAGTLVTLLLQSSSATTSILIGFANVGLIEVVSGLALILVRASAPAYSCI